MDTGVLVPGSTATFVFTPFTSRKKPKTSLNGVFTYSGQIDVAYTSVPAVLSEKTCPHGPLMTLACLFSFISNYVVPAKGFSRKLIKTVLRYYLQKLPTLQAPENKKLPKIGWLQAGLSFA